MAFIDGFGLTNLAAPLALHLADAQSRLQVDAARLSSGLRITSAADDPSGLSIAERQQAQINGYDQAANNVQTANNALTVADAALATIAALISRINVLAIAAVDDLKSASDRANLQVEVSQLGHEIDTISLSTNFNGIRLLSRESTAAPLGLAVPDGQFDTPNVGSGSFGSFQYAPVGAAWTYSVPAFALGAGITSFSSGNGFTGENSQPPPSGAPQVGFIEGTASMSQAISGFKANTAYTISFNAAQRAWNPGDFHNSGPNDFSVLVDGVVQGTFNPIPASFSDPDWTSLSTLKFTPGAGTHTLTFQGINTLGGDHTVFIDNVTIASNVIPPALNLQVQAGATEGNATSVFLPTVSMRLLGLATGSVSNSLSATSLEVQTSSAMDSINGDRAVLGAQMVTLQFQAQNDNIASVNLTASESNIRDANIGQTASAFAKDTILASISTSVLANLKPLVSSVLRLFE